MKLFNFQRKNKPIENLAFIFGCPRSGTTFLWSLLESHESVKPFLLDYTKVDGKYITSESGIYIKEPKNAKKKLTNIAHKFPESLIVEKTPLHTLKYNVISKDFPNNKFVLIFRNPLAIVNSMLKSEMAAFKNYDIEKAILEVKQYYKQLIYIYNKNNTLFITYEKLYNETVNELKKVLFFLNISTKSTEEIVESCKGKVKVNVSGALRKGDPFSYKSELSHDDLKRIKLYLKNEILFYNKL